MMIGSRLNPDADPNAAQDKFQGSFSPVTLGLWASFPQHTAGKAKKYDVERGAKKKNYKFNLRFVT